MVRIHAHSKAFHSSTNRPNWLQKLFLFWRRKIENKLTFPHSLQVQHYYSHVGTTILKWTQWLPFARESSKGTAHENRFSENLGFLLFSRALMTTSIIIFHIDVIIWSHRRFNMKNEYAHRDQHPWKPLTRSFRDSSFLSCANHLRICPTLSQTTSYCEINLTLFGSFARMPRRLYILGEAPKNAPQNSFFYQISVTISEYLAFPSPWRFRALQRYHPKVSHHYPGESPKLSLLDKYFSQFVPFQRKVGEYRGRKVLWIQCFRLDGESEWNQPVRAFCPIRKVTIALKRWIKWWIEVMLINIF